MCYRFSFDDGSFVDCTLDHKFIIDGEEKPCGLAKIGAKFASLVRDEIPVAPKFYQPIGKDKGIAMRGKSVSASLKGKNWKGLPGGESHPGWTNGISYYFKKFKNSHKNCPCEICGCKSGRMEAHHKDEESGKIDPESIKWLCVSCHKKEHYKIGRTRRWQKGYAKSEKILSSISRLGMRETYDLELEENSSRLFMLANGLVTHNSHAVAYGMMSYWCLVLKAKFPLEFAAASLRNAKDDDQSVKILRELVNEGYTYKPYDAKLSSINWSVQKGQLVGGLISIKGVGAKLAESIVRKRDGGLPMTPREQRLLAEGETPWDSVFEAKDRWGHIRANSAKYGIESTIVDLDDIKQDSDGMFVFIAKLTEKNLRDHNELQNLAKRGGQRIEGQTLFLNITVEDDTSSMICTINKWRYLQYGLPIVEEGKIGDWYLIKGENKKGFRKIHIHRWKKLTGNPDFEAGENKLKKDVALIHEPSETPNSSEHKALNKTKKPKRKNQLK